MTFVESIKTCFGKYADFNGRAVRSEYWWFALFVFIVGMVTSTIHPALGGVFYLGVLLPQLAAATRRLHDTNRSGWWQLIAFLPIIGVIILIVFLAQEGKPAESGAAAAA
jgi:uncharacterized membrane protein YhaH (DUF805 family)